MDYSPWNSPGQNTGVGNHSFLQEIFPTQESNPGLPHLGQILYQLSHKRSPRILDWVAYPFSRESSQPRNQTRVSCIPSRFFTNWPIREESSCNAGDLGLIPGLGGSLGEGKGYSLQYSGLENSMDYIVHGVTKSSMGLNNFHFHITSNRLSKYLKQKWTELKGRINISTIIVRKINSPHSIMNNQTEDKLELEDLNITNWT